MAESSQQRGDTTYLGDRSSITTEHYREMNGQITHLYKGWTRDGGKSFLVAKLKQNKAQDRLEVLGNFNHINVLKIQNVITHEQYSYLYYSNVNHTLSCDVSSLFEKSYDGFYQFSSRGKRFFWEFGEPMELLSAYKIKMGRENILVEVGREDWSPILGDSVSKASGSSGSARNWEKMGALIRDLFNHSYTGEELDPEVDELILGLETGKINSAKELSRQPALWSALMLSHFINDAEENVTALPDGSCVGVFVTLDQSLNNQLYKRPLNYYPEVNVVLPKLRNKFERHYDYVDGGNRIRIACIDLECKSLDPRYMTKISDAVTLLEKKLIENGLIALAEKVSESFPINWSDI